MTTTTPTAEHFVGSYGATWRAGVLSEHLDRFLAAGGRTRPAASGSGRTWALLPDGAVVTVVCSELVALVTEDGIVSGRCGADAVVDGAYCAGHGAELAGWRAMTEPERAAWERGRT